MEGEKLLIKSVDSPEISIHEETRRREERETRRHRTDGGVTKRRGERETQTIGTFGPGHPGRDRSCSASPRLRVILLNHQSGAIKSEILMGDSDPRDFRPRTLRWRQIVLRVPVSPRHLVEWQIHNFSLLSIFL